MKQKQMAEVSVQYACGHVTVEYWFAPSKRQFEECKRMKCDLCREGK